MTLLLSYRRQTLVPVEVEGVTPNAVAGKSLAEIERIQVFHGNETVSLGEFFAVSGDPSDRRVQWEGDLSGVHWIGAKMTDGHLHVAGHVGRHLGSQMTGGEIVVEGDAGDWVGGEMRGGMIRVRGKAGHLVGAAYRGSARGMTGGTLLIEGDAGNEVGRAMRRGLLVVGGNAGDLTGGNMLAGTILVLRDSGIRPGAGMRRGTLGLLGQTPPLLLPTFRRACRFRPEILALLVRLLRRHDFPWPDDLCRFEVELYHGDLLEGGRGEVMVRRRES